MKKRLSLFAAAILTLLVSAARAEEVEWAPEANMDRQLFPSLLIATATQRPQEDDEEAKEPDPYMLGDQFGLVGVSIKAPKANAALPAGLPALPVRASRRTIGVHPHAFEPP